jgi:HSP20 family molecular chaperone IbpA
MAEDLSSTKKFWLMLVTFFVAIFLGCFVAFYFLASQINKTSQSEFFFNDGYSHMNMHRYMDEADRMFEDFDRDFEKMRDSDFFPTGMMQFANQKYINGAPTIKTAETPKAYNISVNLKAFNNDPKNVRVKAKGNRISISADYNSKNDDSYKSSAFYESFNLPSKIDASMIKKQVKGNYLTISIPKNSQTGHNNL